MSQKRELGYFFNDHNGIASQSQKGKLLCGKHLLLLVVMFIFLFSGLCNIMCNI